VTIDLCGLEDGRVFLDLSIPTASALAPPGRIPSILESHAPLDLIAGPSGYGLPLTLAKDLTDADLRLAFLAAEGESGGIGGLRSVVRALGRVSVPVLLTPGVIHLATVPAHRKVNRVDLGTADKVCAVALAIRERAERLGADRLRSREGRATASLAEALAEAETRSAEAARRGTLEDVSFILLELGGAFTAAVAVDGGRIVDGIGGSSGPIGLRASGALDGEVAFLAGPVDKSLVFSGGADAIAGAPGISAEALADSRTLSGRIAWEAYIESAAKAVAALAVAVPQAHDVVLSGRGAGSARVRDELAHRLLGVVDGVAVHVLEGFAANASQAAQGAALVADGLVGGASKTLIDWMDIEGASGTVLDHLFVIDQDRARARLGIREP
jgi:predicted butyrate kinase (DUF1464 family)